MNRLGPSESDELSYIFELLPEIKVTSTAGMGDKGENLKMKDLWTGLKSQETLLGH